MVGVDRNQERRHRARAAAGALGGETGGQPRRHPEGDGGKKEGEGAAAGEAEAVDPVVEAGVDEGGEGALGEGEIAVRKGAGAEKAGREEVPAFVLVEFAHGPGEEGEEEPRADRGQGEERVASPPSAGGRGRRRGRGCRRGGGAGRFLHGGHPTFPFFPAPRQSALGRSGRARQTRTRYGAEGERPQGRGRSGENARRAAAAGGRGRSRLVRQAGPAVGRLRREGRGEAEPPCLAGRPGFSAAAVAAGRAEKAGKMGRNRSGTREGRGKGRRHREKSCEITENAGVFVQFFSCSRIPFPRNSARFQHLFARSPPGGRSFVRPAFARVRRRLSRPRHGRIGRLGQGGGQPKNAYSRAKRMVGRGAEHMVGRALRAGRRRIAAARRGRLGGPHEASFALPPSRPTGGRAIPSGEAKVEAEGGRGQTVFLPSAPLFSLGE